MKPPNSKESLRKAIEGILKSPRVNIKDMHWPEFKITETRECLLEENSFGF